MPQNASATSIIPQLKNYLSDPILAPILESRITSLAIVGAAILHTGLVILDLPSWPCPVRHSLGIPCPGCGLSRAITALLHRDWETSLNFHAFAPFFLLALMLMACVILLPPPPRRWIIHQVEVIEQHTGITAILLVGLVFYWLARLLVLREAFLNLITG